MEKHQYEQPQSRDGLREESRVELLVWLHEDTFPLIELTLEDRGEEAQ
jgi:hypothetical protein